MLSRGYAEITVSASDGLRLFSRDYGARGSDALAIVCLPGLTRNSADFHELALALSNDAHRPRRVLALDYRGRGRSEYDPDPSRYDVRIELDDVLQVLTAAGVAEAILVGTSRGGLIAMAMAATRPALVRGAVINDIGPVIEAAGLARIRGYVGKLPTPANADQAIDVAKTLMGPQFSGLEEDDWSIFARSTWTETDGRLTPAYDPALLKTLETLDLGAPLPVLWHLFKGLTTVPVLVLRGANSDILSAATLEAMAKAHPDLKAVTVPDQGHAPLLHRRDTIDPIRQFVLRVDPGIERFTLATLKPAT